MVTEEATYRCYYCERDTSDEDYVMVDLAWSGRAVRCCSTCWNAGDEAGIDLPLDMTTDG